MLSTSRIPLTPHACSTPSSLHRWLALVGLILAGTISSPADVSIPLYLDPFENGSITNSDTITGYWLPVLKTNSTIVESGGKLIMTAGNATSPDATIAPQMLTAGTISDSYNFFKNPKRFKADVTITGDVGSKSNLIFSIVSENIPSYGVNDAVTLTMRGDNVVTLGVKQDKPMASPTGTGLLVNSINLGGAITAFDLSLDATTYTLVMTYSGGNRTFTGAHGLSAAQWSTDGNALLQFETVRAGGAAQTTTATIDNFSVSSTEPTALFADFFNNGIVANSELENAIWTTTLPSSSTATETGSMVLTALSSGTEFLVTNVRTPVQSRFNFFDQQIRVSATMTVSTAITNTALARGRLVLASESSTSQSAADALSVGLFSGNNNLMLVSKTDGPGLDPDSIDAKNKRIHSADESYAYLGSALFQNVNLTLNTKRYQLWGATPITSNTRGAGALRFSGEHQIDRTKWGANGDSALLLESVRLSDSTVAGKSAVTAWDNIRVSTDSAKILNEPYWKFITTYSATNTTGSYKLWLPSTEPVIRGIIINSPGSGADTTWLVHDPAAQEAARAMGFGIIGYPEGSRVNDWSGSTAAADAKVKIQALLDRAAVVSGRPEIANAPIIFTGFSAGAIDSISVAHYWPERIITFVPTNGADWSSLAVSDASKKVPGFFLPGSTDTTITPQAEKASFTLWRSAGAPVAFAINWNIAHNTGGNQGWEAIWPWMVEVTKRRYPRPMVPAQTPGVMPTLLDVAETSGWLGDTDTFTSTTPTTTYSFTTVAPYASYTGTPATASWLPSETMARVYRALNSNDGTTRTAAPLQSPRRIVSPAQFSEPVLVGTAVPIEIDPREFDNTNAIVSMDFYDGEVWLGTDSSGPDWKWIYTPTTDGLHALSVVATDALGNKRDAFRVLNVLLADYPPLAYRKTMTAISNTDTAGTVTGSDPEGNAITFALAQTPAHGTVTINSASGAYTYRSAPGYGGSDSFTFTTNDGAVTSAPGVVAVTVNVDPVGAFSSLNAATGPQAAALTLTWSAVTNAEKYLVERSTLSNSGFVTVATISAPTLFYTDGNLTRDTLYYYRVKATNPVSASAYSVTASATPYVPPTSDGWRYVQFGSPQIVPGVSGDLDTPHRDGITNLMKCALGLSLYNSQGQPLIVSPTSMPYVQEQTLDNSQYLTCTFTHNKSATDLVVRIQVASDPNGPWTDMDPFNAANQLSVTDNTPTVGTETIVVKDSQPIGTTSKRFMRVRVTRP